MLNVIYLLGDYAEPELFILKRIFYREVLFVINGWTHRDCDEWWRPVSAVLSQS